jgi:hypothetical protein
MQQISISLFSNFTDYKSFLQHGNTINEDEFLARSKQVSIDDIAVLFDSSVSNV